MRLVIYKEFPPCSVRHAPHITKYHLPQVASSVVDRVCDISRHFPLALDVGCGRGHIAKLMSDDLIGSLYQLDMADRAVVSQP